MTVVLARSLALGLAIVTVWIAFANGPAEIRSQGLASVASLLVDGDNVRPATMLNAVKAAMAVPLTGPCMPVVTRAASVVLFKEAQMRADNGDLSAAGLYRTRFGELNERTLACAPGSGFDWVLRYWIESVVKIDSAKALASALLSYRTAPYEGWIMIRRLPFLLPAFEIASPELQRHMLDDFQLLARSRVYGDVIDIYTRSSEKLRRLFRDEIAQLPIETRIALVGHLRRSGEAFDMRGVPPEAARPWRR